MKKQLGFALIGFLMVSLGALAGDDAETYYFETEDNYRIEIKGDTVYLDADKLEEGVLHLQDSNEDENASTLSIDEFANLLDENPTLQASAPFGEDYALVVSVDTTCLTQPCPYTDACACDLWFNGYLDEHCDCITSYPVETCTTEACKTERRQCLMSARRAYFDAIKDECI